MCQSTGRAPSSPGSKILSREKNVITQSGDIADLGGKTLAYTSDDPALSDTKRQAIETWENKRGKSKIEFAYMVDENGKMIAENRGGRGSVRSASRDITRSDTFTHIHPRAAAGEEGYLGGTLSLGDLENFTELTNKSIWPNTKLRSYRARAAEGTYFISVSNGYDARGLKAYARELNKAFRSSAEQGSLTARNDYKSGKINYETYVKRHRQAFNAALVDYHNGLLAGQKQYGYIYGLERNK